MILPERDRSNGNLAADPPGPTGIRLRRACAAFNTFSREIWGFARAAVLPDKPARIQELWAQVSDAVIDVMGARIDQEGRSEPLKRKRAIAAAKQRDLLEGRTELQCFEASTDEMRVWMAVVDAVMNAETVPWELMTTARIIHAIGVDCEVFGGDATDRLADVTCRACLAKIKD